MSNENNLLEVMTYTMDNLKQLADANSVLGEKIVIEDTMIIPVSKISVGFAGGGANLVDVNKKKKQIPVGSGGNVTVTPLSFLVIDSDGVRTVNVQTDGKASQVSEIINTVIQQIKSRKKDKK